MKDPQISLETARLMAKTLQIGPNTYERDQIIAGALGIVIDHLQELEDLQGTEPQPLPQHDGTLVTLLIKNINDFPDGMDFTTILLTGHHEDGTDWEAQGSIVEIKHPVKR